VTEDDIYRVDSHGLPIGLFSEQKFTTSAFELSKGSSLVLFSDGVSEARKEEEEYGYERIAQAVRKCAGLAPVEVVANCIRDLETYLGGAPVFDDQTLMVVQKSI
jgi:sigma-B regulation protein RsbU (phosphoserine phosphatase)